MPDIFISYSRKDSTHALELAERLRAEGVESWIDQRGIEGAERWATEIVEGIKACSTFMVLLSPHSVASEHVLKELSLASEKRKRLLPVDVIATELPSSFEYPLSGLQRVAITDFDAILRAHKHGVARASVKDSRKSLMILPFEDLSPASEDNGWFADGLTGELISALSHIKSLRIPDRKTAMDFKGFRGKTTEVARELDVRYFIEGTVRKFGTQIKINVELLDIDTGDYLWQHSYRGEFKDIFDMQEAVAREVVLGLKLHLTPDEQQKVKDRGTENAEAYELYIKADGYFELQTKEGYSAAVQLLSNAILCDPAFANAYQLKANALMVLYRVYNQDPALLVEAESLAVKALRIEPDRYAAYYALSQVYMHQGKLDEAEAAAREFIRNDPKNSLSHFALGFFFSCTGQFAKAIAPYEEAVQLKPDNLSNRMNLAIVCECANEQEKHAAISAAALPYFERHLRLHPDDESQRVNRALLLLWSGRTEEARLEASVLKDHLRDGFPLFNTACLFWKLGDRKQAFVTSRKAIEAGYRNISLLKQLLIEDEDLEQFPSLRGTREYEAFAQMVERIEMEAAGA